MELAGKINPMDWHNTRLLDFIPTHFVRVKFHHAGSRGTVLDWLEKNTSGRCAIEQVSNDDGGAGWLVNDEYQIGFENPADATMYTMFFR